MPAATILVFDTDRVTRADACRELRLAGHDVREAPDIDGALSRLGEKAFDLLMLDITADRSRSLSVLRDLKSSRRQAPVRILITSGDLNDAVRSLRSGADDFLAKPYSLDELIARVDLSLSRQPVAGPPDTLLRAGRITIDDVSHRVTIDDHPVDPAPREYQLLRFFAGNPDRVYSRAQLLGFVWRHGHHLGERTVDVHVRRLRALLEPFGCADYVKTVRGTGYRFEPFAPAVTADRTVTKTSHQ